MINRADPPLISIDAGLADVGSCCDPHDAVRIRPHLAGEDVALGRFLMLLKAFMGLPWPKKIAGIGSTMAGSFKLLATEAAQP